MRNINLRRFCCPLRRIVFLLLTCLVLTLSTELAMAQTYTVLHQFTGGPDGAGPAAGLTLDAGGHLFGTTTAGAAGNGTVFELKRAGSGWVFSPLYSFLGGNDGAVPEGGVVFGPNGTLYGTTSAGGGSSHCSGGCGTVFNLRPPPRACSRTLCPWSENLIYAFQGPFVDDGDVPNGNLVFDPSGNIFGVTRGGGAEGAGTVYELSPSGGSWAEAVLYSFLQGQNDGQNPSGVILQETGSLYGTTTIGGAYGGGVVFELNRSGSSWVESLLHSFRPATDGNSPGGVVADGAGDLYGGTLFAGPYNAGTVWQLTQSNGNWTFNVIYANHQGECGVQGALTLDAAGNIYGATCSAVFELTPSGGGWNYTEIYQFTGAGGPNGNLVLDANGNIYGTTYSGGIGNCFMGCGVVFEISR